MILRTDTIGHFEKPTETKIREAISYPGENATENDIVKLISKPRDDEALVNLVLTDEYDRLDILVNNAAIDAPDGNAWDLSRASIITTVRLFLALAALVVLVLALVSRMALARNPSFAKGRKRISKAHRT
jgi:NAD(P)-dependent dehydrogenase (short-subunit alcohol dehydrogenase family)